ncbi:collagen type IV alpha-3-binding protein [Galendromus occidentalis]|uniref:Ceramide transfer protein n=1 Tax=Galendromus occidentalis TaxID=34638 RepID=A0AAJ6VWA4_9ACAR|nr:collagen type IV alpha-3-binding protein [Galendromus occidentalis]
MAAEDGTTVLSDEDEEVCAPISLHGTLCKWTNYIHGWQQRYFVLANKTLSYYKSENDSSYGCRGAVSIQKAVYKPHEFDECRFDIGVVNGDMWYLRADDVGTRNKWLEAIESHKNADSAYGSDNSLKRHGSSISIGSTMSQTSVSSRRTLIKEKLSEMDTFKGILSKQVDSIQSLYDGLAAVAEIPPAVSDIDVKGEAMTFKATSHALLTACTQCVDLVNQHEDTWRKKLDREVERRKKAEAAVAAGQASDIVPAGGGGPKRSSLINCPDMLEGPHSLLNEEDFFDAVEAFIEQNDQEVEQKRQIRNKVRLLQDPLPETAKSHLLSKEIEETTNEQFRYALMGLGGEGGWQLFAEDGLMKMYKRELEVDGLVCDPLKAVHVVKGVTAREMCYYFFAPEVRYEWETTLESMNVVEVIEKDKTLVFHQIHKRVWPAAQRDALFWSHMEQMDKECKASGDQLGPPVSGDLCSTWMVCNKSCDTPEIPVGRCLRVFLTVCLVGQTYVVGDPKSATRDKLTTRITYCSSINPGGWAPASVLRSIYKREYPKFLKRFTLYVKEQTENKPILF